MTRQLSVKMSGGICALVALLLYLNSLDCGIVFDDEPAIAWNKDLRPTSPWTNLLKHDFWGGSLTHPSSHKSYRPLCAATFRLNYLIHELQPMGYHLVNVLLHSAVCYLYVLLCGVVFGDVWPSLIAGLLFAVHPIHTEAVTGVVGRAELLSASFYLLAFFAYKKSLKNSTGTSYPWIAVSFLLSVCSLLSKEQGITVVAVCLVYDFFIIRKMDLRSSIRIFTAQDSDSRKVPDWFWAFLKRAVALTVLTCTAVAVRLAITGGGPNQKVFHKYVNPPTALETPYRQLSWSYLCFINSWLLLNPFQLSADWRFQAVPVITSLADLHNLLTLATLTVVALLFLYGICGNEKHRKITLSGVIFIVVPYIPASNLFFPVGFVVAERTLYLPSMGFCFLVGYGLWTLSKKANGRKTKLLLQIVIGFLLSVHSLKTVVRNRDWASGYSMYISGLKFNPKSGLMLANLGIEYALKKNYSYAEELYRASTEVAPYYSRGFFNLGKLMVGLHRYSEAERPLQKAIELGMVDTSGAKVAEAFHLLLGAMMQQEHRMEETLELCETALSIYPLYAKLYINKAGILFKLNRTHESVSAALQAIKLDSSLDSAHYALGLASIKTGDVVQAEKAFRDVLFLQPSSTHAMLHLAVVLANTGETHKLQEAEQLLEQLLTFEPNNIEALTNLAQVTSDLLNDDKTQEILHKVIQLQPENKAALYRLAYSYNRSNRNSDTVATLQRLVDIDPDYLDSARLLAHFQKK